MFCWQFRDQHLARDGFMHYRNVVCLLSCSLFLSSAWGCRLSAPEHNIYQKQGKGVVYLRPYKETNLSLPDVNYKSLRRLPNLLIDPTTLDEWDKEPPLTDLTTDYLYEGAQAGILIIHGIAMVAISSTRVKLCKTLPAHLPSMSPRSRHGVILPQINTVSILKASAPMTMVVEIAWISKRCIRWNSGLHRILTYWG